MSVLIGEVFGSFVQRIDNCRLIPAMPDTGGYIPIIGYAEYHLRNVLITNVLQKAVFRRAKGRLLEYKRLPIGMRKAANRIS